MNFAIPDQLVSGVVGEPEIYAVSIIAAKARFSALSPSLTTNLEM